MWPIANIVSTRTTGFGRDFAGHEKTALLTTTDLVRNSFSPQHAFNFHVLKRSHVEDGINAQKVPQISPDVCPAKSWRYKPRFWRGDDFGQQIHWGPLRHDRRCLGGGQPGPGSEAKGRRMERNCLGFRGFLGWFWNDLGLRVELGEFLARRMIWGDLKVISGERCLHKGQFQGF